MAYVAQPPMVVQAGGNKNSKNLPVGADGREWSNGLLSCCNAPGTCVVASCLPCITYGKVRQRQRHLEMHGTPDPSNGGCVSGSCLFHAFTACIGIACILQMMNRGEVRRRYNIKGSGCGDFFAACCCVPCELVQEHQELELEEDSFQGHTGKH